MKPMPTQPNDSARSAASRKHLPWCDFETLDAGRKGRNQITHDRVVLSHSNARDYIAAIERELEAWGIIGETHPELWHW
jgi:hypothetical protein